MKKFDLSETDGNAYDVIRYVSDAMEAAGKSKADVDAWQSKVLKGTYGELYESAEKMLRKCSEGGEA